MFTSENRNRVISKCTLSRPEFPNRSGNPFQRHGLDSQQLEEVIYQNQGRNNGFWTDIGAFRKCGMPMTVIQFTISRVCDSEPPFDSHIPVRP